MPIIADFAEGSYTFPPTLGSEEEGGGVVKTAIHHRTFATSLQTGSDGSRKR
jgi:hypothetical protein